MSRLRRRLAAVTLCEFLTFFGGAKMERSRLRNVSTHLRSTLVALAVLAAPAAAQNYDLDARNVGMGAVGVAAAVACYAIRR